MKSSKMLPSMIAAVLLSSPALGQSGELPAYAYDILAEVTMATTADAKCEGITARNKRVESRVVELYQKLAQDGIGVADAVARLQGEAALAEIARREVELRARHGVAAEGDEALCDAIRAEAGENETLARLLRIR